MKDKSKIYEKGAVITEADGNSCTVRLRSPAGQIDTKKLAALYELTQKYQIDTVHLTTRQTLEIPHIPVQKLHEFAQELENNGIELGAERAEVVNITACPGTERCKFANIDSIVLAEKIDKRYFGKEMPGKIRIAISACPNACTSETLNEMGITGLHTPIRNPGQCTGCGTCVQYCREEALCVDDGKIILYESKCMDCGTCIQSCVYGIIESKPTAYKITIGGRRGRHPKIGMELITVNSEDAVMTVIDAVIDWVYRYASLGIPITAQLGKDLDLEKFKKELPDKLPKGSIAE